MYKNKKITIYFPARNEANHLNKVLDLIPNFVDEVLLVSNNSTDNTLEISKKLGLKVYEDNRVDRDGIGYGFAHQTALKKATGEILIASDIDGTYPIQNLGEILDYFIDNNFDFISCNRYPIQKETKIPLPIYFGVSVLNLEFNLFFGKKIKDILTGMWIVKKEFIQKINLKEGGWNFSIEIKFKSIMKKNCKFGEFPIIQFPRLGKSKMKYIKVGIKHFIYILKIYINSKFLL